MAFNFSTISKTGQTLKARLFLGGTQTGSDITLTESGSTGYYYANAISLTGIADETYTILVWDGTSYLTNLGEVKVIDEMPYEDWVESKIDTLEADLKTYGDSNWAGGGGSNTLGYVNGFVYLDATASNTNTVNYTDGIITNPVSTWAAARTIAESLGTKRIFVLKDSGTLLVSGNSDNYTISGVNGRVNLNGQSFTNALITNLKIQGTFSNGSNFSPEFRNCLIQSAGISGRGAILKNCTLVGSLTATDTSAWFITDSVVQGNISFDADGFTQHLGINNLGGGITYENGASGTVVLTGGGQFTNDGGSTIGNLKIFGNWDYNNSGTVTTFTEDDINEVVDLILEDTDTMEADIVAHGDANWIGEANTETEIHTWLNSYTSKDDWKATVPTASSIADSVWDELTAGHVGAGSFGKLMQDIIDGVDAIYLDTDELQLNQGNWLTATGFSTHTPAAVYAEFTSGSNEDVFKADLTGIATSVQVSAVETNVIAHGDSNWSTGVGVSAAAVADAVWDELQADHVTVGTFGEIATEIASILGDTNELQTDWADAGRLDIILDAAKLHAKRAEQLSA